MAGRASRVGAIQRARGLRAVVSSFARGIVDDITPDQIPEDAVADALNVEFDRQRNLRTRQGCARLNWNGNLVGAGAVDLEDATWTPTDGAEVHIVADDFDAPSGDAYSVRLTDGGNYLYAESAEAGDAEIWSISAYLRVPLDPVSEPVGWTPVLPGIALVFTGGTDRGAGIVLVPDVAAEHQWKIKPITNGSGPYVSFVAPAEFSIGEVFLPEDAPDFQWIQVKMMLVNDDTGNTTAEMRLLPAVAAYSVSGSAFVYATDPAFSGSVPAADTTTHPDVVGIWGASLERGRGTAHRPIGTATSATIADNYFGSRVTSVTYYRTPDDASILATSGADLYRFSSTNAWFEKITGDLDFPFDTLWQWTQFDGKLIGVNRGTGTRATGTLTGPAGPLNFADGDTVTLGDIVYRFKDTPAAPYDVQRETAGTDEEDLEATLQNLALAIDGTGAAGVQYFAGTAANEQARTSGLTATTLTVSAILPGVDGNSIATTETGGGSWGDTSLSGGTGDANPVMLPTPGGDPEGLSNAPPGRYVFNWNGRVWIVPEAEPWTIVGSALGDAEDWISAGPAGTVSIQVGWQETFDITGWAIHQGVLIVFKRDRIYAVVPGANPADASEYAVQTLQTGIGSVSGYAIGTILEDLVFMSAYGLVALSMLTRVGHFAENTISRDVRAFSDPNVVEERAVLLNYPRKGQTLIAFAPRLGARNSQAYVLDYRGASRPELGVPAVGFTRASGPLQCVSGCLADVATQERLLLGGEPDAETGIAYVWLYDEEGSFEDEGRRYPVSIRTKAYTWSDLFQPKRFHRWEALFELLEDEIDMSLLWKPDLQEGVFQQFTVPLVGQSTPGALWDSGTWDTSLWSTEDVVSNVFVGGRFAGSAQFGTTARALQATIQPAGEETGFVLKGFQLIASYGRDVPLGGDLSGVGSGLDKAMVTEAGFPIASEEGDIGVYE